MKNIVPFDTLDSLWTVLIRLNSVTGKPVLQKEYYQACENQSRPGWFDRLMLKGLPEEEPLRSLVLQEAIALAKTPGSGKLFTYIEEDLGPQVADALVAAGFTLSATHAGMVRPVTEDDLAFGDPRIRRIGPEDLLSWCDVRTRGFQKPTPIEVHKIMFPLEGNRYYALEEDGEMRSVGMVCIDKDQQNLSLQSIATPPEYRGRGLACAIVSHIAKEAAQLGAPLLSLQASPLGEPVYARLGYRRIATIRSWIFEE
ncbi:MAG: GNAT family N-acetyltransferase [Firmicutes bacterium]|nr:GNAT family N-acetyltransferase [Bacillota bacterium]